MSELLLRDIKDKRLTLTLNRPEIRNALNDDLIEELTVAFEESVNNSDIRLIVLAANGKAFCAGADLNWMKALVDASLEENKADAKRLVRLLDAITQAKVPVIARVSGAALGGGMGFIAACDVVVAHPRAKFGLTEVRLGLAPAMIFPYLLRKIQKRDLLEHALRGALFDAQKAMDIGLVNRVDEDLDGVIDAFEQDILSSGSNAISAVKTLFNEIPDLEHDDAIGNAVNVIATLRKSEEGQEGMRAFLERRSPHWLEKKAH